jgi:hypothetical protein
LSFDPGDLYRRKQHKYESIIENIIIIKMKMKMIFAIIAMLLSTASARTLKSRTLKAHSCDTDYQAPNYWGKCVDGKYRNVDRYWDGKYNEDTDCGFLVILVSQDSVGDKTLTVEYESNGGHIVQNSTGSALTFNDFGYHSLISIQDGGSDSNVNVRFFLDGTKVHEGNYQQNQCFLEAGAITTNDPNAVTYEGSWGIDMPGHVITSF